MSGVEQCGLCGGPDPGHRVIEGMLDRLAAGEPFDDVLNDYGLDGAAFGRLVGDAYRRAYTAWVLLEAGQS